MSNVVLYALLGVGTGASLALLALGLVLTNRASGTINFAHAAIGMYLAHVFYELRANGALVLPIVGLPARIQLVVEGSQPTIALTFVITLAYAALVGAAIYLVIFRQLRRAPALGRLVASVGLFLYTWAMVGLRFPIAPPAERFLPTGSVQVLGKAVFIDRLVIAALAAVLTAVLFFVYRFTRFGMATNAAADSEKGALLIGLNPDRLAVANWMIATMLAALASVLIAHVTKLDALQMSMLIVPVLAAALLGGFRSFVWVALAGLGIGMAQTELNWVQNTVPAFRGVNLSDTLPFVLIVIALYLTGRSLPTRGDLVDQRLPRAPRPVLVVPVTVLGAALGVVVLMTAGSDWRTAVINSSIAILTSLSVVVLTGFVGQISLAPAAFAGVAAYALTKFADLGVPFPIAPLLAALLAMGLGVIVGIPAVRVRGMSLAIATLGAATAIEKLVLHWSWFTSAGNIAADPSIGRLDLSIAAKGDAYPRVAFGIMCVVVVSLCCVAVANLRRGTTGLHWLAVRSNERAAATSGIDVNRAKLVAFALSALLAGLGGALLAYQRRTLSADYFGVFVSLAALAVTYLAGVASMSGAVVAGLLTPLGVITVLTSDDLTKVSPYAYVINGALLVLAAIVLPSGITGAVATAFRWLAARLPGRAQRPAMIV